MGDRTKLGFKNGNYKARSNKRKNNSHSEETFYTKMKRRQRHQMRIQKEQYSAMHIEDMNIEDLKEYMLETEY